MEPNLLLPWIITYGQQTGPDWQSIGKSACESRESLIQSRRPSFGIP